MIIINTLDQVALGHEGVHAILVLDNGTALFTGVARRGEDGDANRHRRTPKPTRPKKILRVLFFIMCLNIAAITLIIEKPDNFIEVFKTTPYYEG